MAKLLTYILFFFLGIVFINYAWTQIVSGAAGSAISPIPLRTAASVAPAPAVFAAAHAGGASVKGLPALDFDLFGKGGSGWSYVTQGYGRTPYSGWYIGGWHNGIDIAALYGTPIDSASNGTVIAVGNQDNYCPKRGFGKFIAIRDDANNMVDWYAHLGAITVSAGQHVSRGDRIASVGDTGLETGTHLHFSVFIGSSFLIADKNGCGPDAIGHDVDPVPYLERLAE
ncbi:MAG TPA: M23 family metallopeptidase [Candidatus Paceibacterota bacterium]|nr:M23 family metallopeptidase [Candidatus Paceibacterota bacterium]